MGTLYPIRLIVSVKVLTSTARGSIRTLARSVARLTLACCTPSSLARFFSTRPAQAAHVIPEHGRGEGQGFNQREPGFAAPGPLTWSTSKPPTSKYARKIPHGGICLNCNGVRERFNSVLRP